MLSGKWWPFCLSLHMLKGSLGFYFNLYHILQYWERKVILMSPLTHLPLDKMDTISQTTFSDVFSWMKIKISLKFIPKHAKGQIDNDTALV